MNRYSRDFCIFMVQWKNKLQNPETEPRQWSAGENRKDQKISSLTNYGIACKIYIPGDNFIHC